MRTKVISKLKELNTIPYLNRGGCAIAALAVHEYASKLGVQTEVVFLLSRAKDYSDLSNNKPATCMHAVIKINNCYYDSDGRVYKKRLPGYFSNHIKCIPISKILLIESIRLKEGWNHTFDRKKNLPKIDKIIGIPISKLIKD